MTTPVPPTGHNDDLRDRLLDTWDRFADEHWTVWCQAHGTGERRAECQRCLADALLPTILADRARAVDEALERAAVLIGQQASRADEAASMCRSFKSAAS